MSSHTLQTTVPIADSPKSFIAAKLILTCEHLLDKGLYLSSPSLHDDVVWSHVGTGNQLVTKSSVNAVVEAQATSLVAESGEHTASMAPDVAHLSLIVSITNKDFWMTSCGMWKGSTTAVKMLTNVKPTCTGGMPDHHIFEPDFAVAMENVHWLMDQILMPGNAKQGMVFGNGNKCKLKFRHVLFEVCMLSYQVTLFSIFCKET
jgi:hypothetical protein